MTTDAKRRQWLIAKGYTPTPKPENNHLHILMQKSDSEFVDHCISNGWCPAYFRPCQNLAEAKLGPMVFVKKGDRARIDWAMSQ